MAVIDQLLGWPPLAVGSVRGRPPGLPDFIPRVAGSNLLWPGLIDPANLKIHRALVKKTPASYEAGVFKTNERGLSAQ